MRKTETDAERLRESERETMEINRDRQTDRQTETGATLTVYKLAGATLWAMTNAQ